jgi:dolichyl-phosphate beta-glucosyltransferase
MSRTLARRAPAPACDLSVVVPAFNEERRLAPTLLRLQAYLRQRRVEVLVVDDGSTDSTAALVRAMARRWKALRLVGLGANAGKGAAVRRGVMEARGRAVLFSDADLSTPIEELPRLEAALKNGFSIAIGSRALDRARVGLRQPFYREAGGRLFNKLVQAFTVSGIEDTQCGFKLFEAAAAKRLFSRQQVPRFGFDVEVLYLARRCGYRIAELPVRWENSPETKVRPVRDGLRAFLDLGLIRIYDLQGRYQGL